MTLHKDSLHLYTKQMHISMVVIYCGLPSKRIGCQEILQLPIFGARHLSSCSVTSPLALVGCQELTGSPLAKSAAKSAAAAGDEAGEEEEKMEENTAAEGGEEEEEEEGQKEQEKTTAVERVDKRVRRGYLHCTVCPQ